MGIAVLGGRTTPSPLRRCAFCGKEQGTGDGLISGLDGVAICYACVDTCNQIVADQARYEATYGKGTPSPTNDRSA